MAIDSKLESMPTELKIALLEQVSDIHSLSTFIHASPIFHAVYLANREDILTKTTLPELSTKNQSLNIDELLKPAGLCHLVTKAGDLDANLEPAIKAGHAQANNTTDIKLSVDHCIALRTLLFYYSWQIEESHLPTPHIHLVAYPNNKATYKAWSNPIRSCFMHVLLLDDNYDQDHMCRLCYRGPDIGWDPFTIVDTLRYTASKSVRRSWVWIPDDGVPMTWAICQVEGQDLQMLYAAHRRTFGAGG
jgi:hypothetical protein